MVAQPNVAPGEAAAPEPGAGAWWMVFVLFTFYLMSYVDRTIVAHLVSPLKQSLALSDFQMGLVLGPAFAFTYSIAMLPAGWIVDRFDRRLVVGGAMIFWSLMTMACGLASSAIGLVAGRMLIAVGEALLTPSAYALIGDRFPRRSLASALALYNTGAKAGTSVAFFVAAAAIAVAGVLHANGGVGAHFEPWQIVFFLVGAPGLVLGLLPVTFGRQAGGAAQRAAATTEAEGAVAFIRGQAMTFAPLVLGITFVALANGALAAWLPTLMQRTYGWDATRYGAPIGTLTAIAAVLTVPQGLLVDRLYARGMRDAAIRYLTWMLLIAAPLTALTFVADTPALFLLGIGGLLALIVPYPLYLATTLQLISPPQMRGRLTGLLIGIIPMFSQGLGPMLIGGLTDFVFHDPQQLPAALSIVMVGGMVASFVCLRIALRTLGPLLTRYEAA